MSQTDDAYKSGLQIGRAISLVRGHVLRVATNVREFARGIEDAARGAQTKESK